MTSPHNIERGRAGGFTLIEMLVTVVIMALGLLGFAALQSVAIKNNRTALNHSYATFFAHDIIDRMRANRIAAFNGDYNCGFDGAPTEDTIAADDVVAWKEALDSNLPPMPPLDPGHGSITVNNNGAVLIEIRWPQREARWIAGTFSSPEDIKTFSTQTNL